MVNVHFTPHLKRHIDCDTIRVDGDTLAVVLEAAFGQFEKLRGYVVDDQGRLRKHVVVFIDGEPAQDRLNLTDPVGDDSSVYVMQALSGG